MPVVYRKLIERDDWRAHARVVEEHVEPSEPLVYGREQRFHRHRVAHVATNRDRAVPR
jgi:hypothetical protein